MAAELREADVVVVGAGLAGLVAARELIAAWIQGALESGIRAAAAVHESAPVEAAGQPGSRT